MHERGLIWEIDRWTQFWFCHNQWQYLFFSYKTLFLRNYIRLHTTSSYQIDGPAKTETIPLLMPWNRLSPIPKSSRWYQYIYMQTATYNKHPQTCFNKHNRCVNHIKITVHSIMSLKYMSPSSFHQFCSFLATCRRDLVMLFYTIAFFPQCMHHKLEYDRYLINMQYVINKFWLSRKDHLSLWICILSLFSVIFFSIFCTLVIFVRAIIELGSFPATLQE